MSCLQTLLDKLSRCIFATLEVSRPCFSNYPESSTRNSPVFRWHNRCYKDLGNVPLFHNNNSTTRIHSILALPPRRRREPLLAFYKATLRLTQQSSLMAQLVIPLFNSSSVLIRSLIGGYILWETSENMHCFRLHDNISDTLARKALWQDGLGRW